MTYKWMNQGILSKAFLFGIGNSLILISSQPILAATFEARSQITIPTTFGGIPIDRQEVRTSLLEETITVFSATDDAEGRAVISLDPKLSSTSRAQKTTFGNAISGSGVSSATIGYEIIGIPGVSLPNEYITLNFPIMGNFEGIANGNEDEVAFFSVFSGVSFNLSIGENSAFGFANIVASTPDSVFLSSDSNVFGKISREQKNSRISFDNILSLQVPLSSLSGQINSSVTAGSLSQGPGSTSQSSISLSPIPQSVTADDVLLNLLKRTSENGEVSLRFETGEEIRIVSNQQKRFEEEQKKALSEGSSVNSTFALLMSLTLFKRLSLILSSVSFSYQELSKDPPDPNFNEISVPLDLVSKYQPISDESVGLKLKEAFDLISINLLELSRFNRPCCQRWTRLMGLL